LFGDTADALWYRDLIRQRASIAQIRGSLAYRSDYLQRVPAQNVVNDVEGKNSTLNVDASASYQITDAITLTAEAINLTDEFNDQFVDRDRNSPSVIHHTGRQFYIGARVRF